MNLNEAVKLVEKYFEIEKIEFNERKVRSEIEFHFNNTDLKEITKEFLLELYDLEQSNARNYENPSDDGIKAAKQDAVKRMFIGDLCNEFKAFCLDSIDRTEDFEDHLEFLKASLEVFIDMKSEENE
jgi:hypothetical protein